MQFLGPHPDVKGKVVDEEEETVNIATCPTCWKPLRYDLCTMGETKVKLWMWLCDECGVAYHGEGPHAESPSSPAQTTPAATREAVAEQGRPGVDVDPEP